MNLEKTIEEIELLEYWFTLVDDRPLQTAECETDKQKDKGLRITNPWL